MIGICYSSDMAKIKYIYWDLDGTLYRFHAQANDTCNRSAARAAIVCGANEPEEAIIDHYDRVYDPHILPESLKTKADFDRHHFHHLYHDGLDLKRMIEPVSGVSEAFARVNVVHVIVTHGSRPWAERALKTLGIRQYFKDSHIFCLEDMNFSGKGASPRAYLEIMQKLGHAPHQVAMVEDSHKNLVYAHQLGMTTFLLRHGLPASDPLPHVMHQVSHISEIFKILGLPVVRAQRKSAYKPHCA